MYQAIDRLVEAADWIVWQLCGTYVRNACSAGYKGIRQDGQYPSREFLAEVHPDFADFVTEKLDHPDRPARRPGRIAHRAGRRMDRASGGHPRRRRQRRCPRHRRGGRRAGVGAAGRDHGNVDLPRDELRSCCATSPACAASSTAESPRQLGIRSRAIRRRRHLRLVRRQLRPGELPRRGPPTRSVAARAPDRSGEPPAGRRTRPGRPGLAQREPFGARRSRALRRHRSGRPCRPRASTCTGRCWRPRRSARG